MNILIEQFYHPITIIDLLRFLDYSLPVTKYNHFRPAIIKRIYLTTYAKIIYRCLHTMLNRSTLTLRAIHNRKIQVIWMFNTFFLCDICFARKILKSFFGSRIISKNHDRIEYLYAKIQPDIKLLQYLGTVYSMNFSLIIISEQMIRRIKESLL